MTLKRYVPDRLDELALRVFDVAGRLRRMAERCREQGLSDLPINDKKALEWLTNLDQWSVRAEGELDLRLHKHRGAQRAKETQRK